MAFYLKYRSKKIDELDLKSVRNSLTEVVRLGDIPHAFLFSGPKGTGKTSAARILAKVINCENKSSKSIEPCNKCKQCKLIDSGGNIDVIELDAASNRGIDDIRSLRDAVKLSPANAPKKVYVIDEAHMLTTEASNALLKTLEEPPEHVVFILATTNPEKLIGTIRSRTIQIRFKKAANEEILRSLKRVVKGEKIKADEEALLAISEAADGSFRDAHKLLEQLSVGKKKLTKELIQEKLDTASPDDLRKFVQFLIEKDKIKLLKYIESVSESGADMKMFLETVIKALRRFLLVKHGINEGEDIDIESDELVQLIELLDNAYGRTGTTAIEQLPLEITVVRWCEEWVGDDSGEGVEVEKESGSEKVKDIKIKGKNSKALEEKKNGESVKKRVFKRKDIVNGNSISGEIWKEVLLCIRPKNASTEALLRAAKPLQLDGDVLTVGVFYNFHKERLEERIHRTFLEEALCEVMGKNIRIMCKLTEPPKKPELIDVKKEAQNGGMSNGEMKQQEQEEKVLTPEKDDDIVKIAEEIFG